RAACGSENRHDRRGRCDIDEHRRISAVASRVRRARRGGTAGRPRRSTLPARGLVPRSGRSHRRGPRVAHDLGVPRHTHRFGTCRRAPPACRLQRARMLAPHTRTAGAVLLVVGAAVLVAVYGALWRRRYDQAVVVQGLGAVLALGAAICLLGGVPVQSVVPWLAGFLVLTIAGERLELATLHMPPHAGRALVLLAASVGCGALIALLWPASTVLFGVVLAGTAAWLVRFDVARRTVRAGEPARFMACAMLAGQAWLVVAASLWLVTAAAWASEAVEDARTRAVLLGFAMWVVMAHAPVILPAVGRIPRSPHRGMYLRLLLLHAGLVVRLWLGDALGLRLAWQVGGVVTVLSLLGFLAAVGWSLIRTGDKRGAR